MASRPAPDTDWYVDTTTRLILRQIVQRLQRHHHLDGRAVGLAMMWRLV